ncbi:TcpE family conjugal transfer membrane protein [Paenibacillus polymyxa]|uniref:TcpE family conjugal transfer membrane protein n=1 Tax=Paenibacillus polymyxa TaxID=1406 RepID=UPI000F880F07|nr:TcpE family conjugal transfer membrane protein [Paenibacillus polymyxa]MDN4081222.1 hypothetical protein [Paenibacillus polymyxa]MDN4106925.1 hypothetical protein [Paenibacillus polymyxa]MDN4116862.1 hypothetical protein [Paenibacillus polymyxa]QDA30288.1 hypothetical protein FGY93_25560 [Paenibacillus polymyxa]RTZ29735.1 hypothetical protein EJ573_24690 [Paenibacillus polymyxa]
MEPQPQRRDLFVLNEFLVFERRLYQFAGFAFGRALKIKTIGYFIALSIFMLIWYHIPILNIPLLILPNAFSYMAPFLGTYLLVDVGTENRPPIKFFKSFCTYHWRKSKRVTYYKGMELGQPQSYGFNGQLTVRERQAAKKKLKPTYRFDGYFTVGERPVKKVNP